MKVSSEYPVISVAYEGLSEIGLSVRRMWPFIKFIEMEDS